MEPYVWPLLLFLAGIAIIGVELFVPSGGLLGVLAALCFLGGIGLAFANGFRSGVVMLIITAAAVPALLAMAVHLWPNTPIGRRILGQLPEHPDEMLPDTEPYRGLKELIGRRGRANCMMLPGGTVVIERRSYEAVTLGMAIDDQAAVEVVDIRMGRLVVRPCVSTSLDDSPPARSAIARSAEVGGGAGGIEADKSSGGLPEQPGGQPSKKLANKPQHPDDLLSTPIESLGIEDPLA